MPTSPNLQLENGQFQDFEGNALNDGYLLLQLSHDAEVASVPCQVVGAFKIRVPLNSMGSIPTSPATLVWSNDVLQPGGTFYIVMAFKADGTEAWVNPQYWSLAASPDPLDVGTIIPSNPPFTGLIPMSPAVLLNPTGNQVISADNLNPASGNTTQSLGVSGSRWNAFILNEDISGTLTDGAASVGTSGQILSSTGTEVKWVNAASATPAFSALTSGTNTAAAMVVGSGATLSTSGSGVLNANEISGITVSGTPTSGQVLTATSGTAADWQNTSAGSFSTITSGTNTTATMTVGSGATLATSGSGVINASEIDGVTVSGTPSSGQVLTATSSSAAAWQTGLLLPSSGLRLQFGGPVGAGTTTFPIAFSGTPTVVLGNVNGSVDINSGSVNTTGFGLAVSSGSTAYWIAIGPA